MILGFKIDKDHIANTAIAVAVGGLATPALKKIWDVGCKLFDKAKESVSEEKKTKKAA